MTGDTLTAPQLTANPTGRALSATEAATALARREAQGESVASLAHAFGTSEGRVALAISDAIKARSADIGEVLRRAFP